MSPMGPGMSHVLRTSAEGSQRATGEVAGQKLTMVQAFSVDSICAGAALCIISLSHRNNRAR